MLLELGSVRISTGRHSAAPVPSATDQEKALPAGARVARDLSDDAAALTSGAKATGQPPTPGPLPAPSDTPRVPIRFEYPHGYNQSARPGRGKIAAFATLRQLAAVHDITRICIETRKDQLCGLEWSIVPRDKALAKAPTTAAAIAQATTFFRSPDKRRDFQTWLRLACEEVFVVDALSIYRRRTRGGQLFALEIKDGATIVPLLDESGDTPLPPAVAYRQVIRGVPIEGGDCTADELYYRPRVVSVHTPYGLSPTEAVLLTVNAALLRSTFNLAHYSEGNIPRGLMSAPESWSGEQIKLFQATFDEMLAGNATARSRVRLVGHGMAESFKQYVEPDFQTAFDEFLIKVCCAAFGVTPSEIGFTAQVNKSTSDGQENITYRRLRPLKSFFEALFTEVLERDLGLPGLVFTFVGGEPEDRLREAKIDEIYLRRGVISGDDIRIRRGQDPIGLGPMIDTPSGPVPVASLLMRPPDLDPDTPEAHPTGSDNVTPASAEDLQADAKKELRDWRTVALKDLKAGRPVRAFRADVLPADTIVDVRRALAGAETAAAVTQAFAAVADPVWPDLVVDVAKREHTVFIGAARVAQARFQRHFASAFRAEGAAIITHLRDGMASQVVTKADPSTSEALLDLLLVLLDAFPWEEWATKHLLPGYQQIYRDLVIRTAKATVTRQAGVWTFADPFLSEWMTGYVGRRIAQIQGTTRTRVIALVRRSLASGTPMTTTELGKLVFDAISALHEGYARWRANTIARTETGFALNHGTLLGYHQAGVTLVDVFDGEDDDEPCRAAHGAVWTIPYALEHALEHPNCVRTFAAHQPKPPQIPHPPTPEETTT